MDRNYALEARMAAQRRIEPEVSEFVKEANVNGLNVQTVVMIDKDWVDTFKSDDCIVTMPIAIHISIDPITKLKSAVFFTDDGRGNGTPVISFFLD
jgi:tetrahydromethanopterin S-methyltransferase subunit D